MTTYFTVLPTVVLAATFLRAVYQLEVRVRNQKHVIVTQDELSVTDMRTSGLLLKDVSIHSNNPSRELLP